MFCCLNIPREIMASLPDHWWCKDPLEALAALKEGPSSVGAVAEMGRQIEHCAACCVNYHIYRDESVDATSRAAWDRWDFERLCAKMDHPVSEVRANSRASHVACGPLMVACNQPTLAPGKRARAAFLGSFSARGGSREQPF